MTRPSTFAVATLLGLGGVGCGVLSNTPAPLSDERPAKGPIASRTEARLSDVAKFPPEGGSKRESRVVLALGTDAQGNVLSGERPTVAFSFRELPPRESTPPELRDAAVLAATLDADGKSLVVVVRPTSGKLTVMEEGEGGEAHEATFDKVQVMIARKRDEAGSHDARLHVARVFGLDATKLEGRYQPVTLQTFVLGTKLVKSTSPHAFRSPGAGTWTLLRIVGPGEGYLALDWEAGRGEIFPKGSDPTALAEAILRVM